VGSGLPKKKPVWYLAASGPNVLAVMGSECGPLYLSTYNGSRWTRWRAGSLEVVEFLGECEKSVFAILGGKISRSTDNGVSWTALDLKDSNSINSVLVSGTDLFLRTVTYHDTVEIFRSTDNGTTWTSCKAGLPEKVHVTGLLERGSNLIASTWDNGIFLSTDRGASWKAINAGWPGGLCDRIRISGKYLYAVTWASDILRLPLAEISFEGR
jgi:hypothetical protein